MFQNLKYYKYNILILLNFTLYIIIIFLILYFKFEKIKKLQIQNQEFLIQNQELLNCKKKYNHLIKINND